MVEKKKLGISGILTNEYAWRCLPDESIGRSGIQIDLLIDRSDGIIDVCEMKYSKDSYTITSDYANELARKRNVFQTTLGLCKVFLITSSGYATFPPFISSNIQKLLKRTIMILTTTPQIEKIPFNMIQKFIFAILLAMLLAPLGMEAKKKS